MGKVIVVLICLGCLGFGAWKVTSYYLNAKRLKQEAAQKVSQAAEVIIPEDPEIKEFVAKAKIGSILLGSPKIVVINKKDYEEGQTILMKDGRQLVITQIDDAGVILSAPGNKTYRLKLEQATPANIAPSPVKAP